MTNGGGNRFADTTRRPAVVWLAAIVVPVVVVGVTVGLVLATAAGDGGRHGPSGGFGLTVAPLDLESVSPDIASHYRYAADHEAAYREIPCYCGCEVFLDHRNLYECFLRPDGNGWDAHAAGCGVCIGESTTAGALLDKGMTPAAARDAVTAQFGSTPPTAPPRA